MMSNCPLCDKESFPFYLTLCRGYPDVPLIVAIDHKSEFSEAERTIIRKVFPDAQFDMKTQSDEFEVMFDFEINSHSKIKDFHQISRGARHCGFQPWDGEPVTNRTIPLPDKVADKIRLIFQMYFPNRESIAEWIRKNYKKQGDESIWDEKLLLMTNKPGKLLSKRYFSQMIERQRQMIEWHQSQIEFYQQTNEKYGEENPEDFWDDIEFHQKENEYHYKEIERYQKEAENCLGIPDETDIEKFLAYFLDHPNDYWKNKVEGRKVEYKSFVKV